MNESDVMTLEQIEELAYRALTAAGTSDANARALARATAATEGDGISSHGLAYIPIYCEHVRCGKVDGHAEPELSCPYPSVVAVDARSGFAHPAIDLGFEALIPTARAQGIAALAVRNSYNCGVLGYHTRRIAQAGLLAIGFTNAPASIAPVGGSRAIVGTNPFSLAAPDGAGGTAILIDQSASVVAKSEVMKRAREGTPIPTGWALGPDGRPTTDPDIALKGSMAPVGGYKGVGVALMVEIMAAAMTGATLGVNASPFSGPLGGPPNTGQFFLALDPAATSHGLFNERLGVLVEELRAQPGARIPGDGRAEANRRASTQGVTVDPAVVERVNDWT